MINTLDSMIGYRSERYEYFGKFAARLDDVVNFIPSRLTALLMPVVSFSKRGWAYIFRYGHQHKSPNSGYPEAALAGIINARFGGPNIYHGQLMHKPFIGANERIIQHQEIQTVSRINHRTCLGMIILLIIFFCFQYLR
jgi:adenosylcobinamide-phosphate synthase